MMKTIGLLFALIYMIFLCWISLDCDEDEEYEIKYLTLGLAGLVPLVICVIIAL